MGNANGKRMRVTNPLGYVTYGTYSNNLVAVSRNYIAAVARHAAPSAKRIHDVLDITLSISDRLNYTKKYTEQFVLKLYV